MPDTVRGRIFTLLDMTWSTMRLLSVALAMVLVDALDIAPRYWVGGTLLALASFLGLVFSVQHHASPQDELRGRVRELAG